MKNIEKIADIHCHIIPEVDDGAGTIEESMKMIADEYRQGVRLIIMTPHWRRGMFETDRRTVYDHFIKLCEPIHRKYPDLRIFQGCEFHVDADMIDEISSNSMLRMNGSDFVLTEFSGYHDREYIREALNQEISSGYIPVIAHIERYPACTGQFEFISELRKMGAKVQVNADSVTGRDGRKIRHMVLELIKRNLVDFIGSDAHNMRDRSCHLLECEKILLKKFGYRTTEHLMWENPNEIIKENSGRDEK